MAKLVRNWTLFTARLVVAVLAIVGLIGVLPIAYQQIIAVNDCPALGPIPACYIVLAGYVLIGASILIGARWRSLIFSIGWVPVFGLALTGTSLELLGQNACPKTSSGIPACFLSLAILTVIVLAFIVQRAFLPGRDQKDKSG
jgi:hypothetical protein